LQEKRRLCNEFTERVADLESERAGLEESAQSSREQLAITSRKLETTVSI
jgi:hypothetical protein